MYRYAANHIPSYKIISTYPNDPEYNPNTNGVTNFSYAFFGMSRCKDTIGSIMNRFDWNSCTDMSNAFSTDISLAGMNFTGSIPKIPNSVINMSHAFFGCHNLTGSIPNIPNSVINMSYAFSNCSNLSSSNVYIHSNNVSNAINCFCNMRNTMNIYVHANTTTYNSFYEAMGNSTYNDKWRCYLKTF